MPHLHLASALILLGLGFIAAFIDSTVGGGGLISLPALLFVGLPPALALGTNKLGGTISALTSTFSYLHSRKITWRVVRYLIPLAFIGSVLGADLVRHLPTAFLRPLVVIMLIVVTLYTVFRRDLGKYMTYTGMSQRMRLFAVIVAVIIGFYDGFFGPGTGSFLIISFLLLGFDFVQASANGKVLNLASNVAALLTFAALHTIDYTYGLCLGAGMMVGAFVGSQLAIRKGVGYIRPIFIGVTVVMIGNQMWKLWLH